MVNNIKIKKRKKERVFYINVMDKNKYLNVKEKKRG